MADTLLTVSNLETYYGPIMAIRGVSFSVPRGKIVTILGANGAGKTTILKTISGVMDPQKGTVALEGRLIQGMDPDKVTRLGLTHVPEGREVFPFLTVHENLRMGAFTRNDAGDIARDLETVYDYFPVLRARAGQTAGSLSGGEQQMLSISRALMARGRIVMEAARPWPLGKDDIKGFYLGVKESSIRGMKAWKRTKTWRSPE